MGKASRRDVTKTNMANDLAKVEMSSSNKAAAQSVIDSPSYQENRHPGAYPILMMVASAADDVIPWGIDVRARDIQLRNFIHTESVLMSAIYSVSARNASFAWEVVPADPRDDVRYTRTAATRILENAENGAGWNRFMFKTCESLYSQDNGAFWELVRREDNPASPVVGINTLDPTHCTRTGDPLFPVIYKDRYGRQHVLKNYQVATLEENPSGVEEMYSVQKCAVSRALRMAQILRSVFIYKDEKVSGRNPRSLDFVSGVGMNEIEDAKKLAEELANNMGLSRYSSSVLIPGIDPTNPVTHVRVDLASLPDNFAFDEEMKWYISILALAFGVDYQEFAPLPTSSMGSGAQSEILHLKTHGKGPAAIMGLIEHVMNNRILPSTIKFRYKAHDAQTEAQKATAAYTRGRDRSLRLQAGELDNIAARNLAIEQGDLPEWIAAEMETRGVEAQPPVNQPTQEVPQNNQQQNNQQQDNTQQDSSQHSANQIQGAQQGALQKEGKFIDGGMNGVPKDFIDVSEEEINQQRLELSALLGKE